MSIPENLAAILARIEAARKAAFKPAPATSWSRCPRPWTKRASAQALAAGQRLFGENRVQEAQGKFPALKREFPDLELHLIGPLADQQGQRGGGAVRLPSRPWTAPSWPMPWRRSATEAADAPSLFVQVNTGEEPQKAGVMPDDTAALIAYARKLNLPVIGLMCIPPVDRRCRAAFRLSRQAGARQWP